MNRKAHRANDNNNNSKITSADEIPLSSPSESLRSGSRDPEVKTLYEIAAEKQAELLPGTKGSTTPTSKSNSKFTFRAGTTGKGRNSGSLKPENVVHVKIGQDGKVIPEQGSSLPAFSASGGDIATEESDSPWLDTLLLASSLSAVHFTLSVLAMHQYAEKLLFKPLFSQTLFIAFPTLAMLIALFHGHLLPSSLYAALGPSARNAIMWLRSVVYVVTANVAGCYLIMLTNDRGYYAVMKDAPSVGTLWVWAVMEMGLLGALAGVVGPGLYAWWKGYGIM